MTQTEEVKSSWADDVEEAGGELPQPSEVCDGDLKIVTEYRYNDDDKREKIVRTYKVEKRKVSKSIAVRKNWPKFGVAKGEKPGPNPATTIVSEDIFMQFISSREEQDKPDEDALDRLKNAAEKTVKCRHCSGDHWSLRCPFKDTIMKNPFEEKKPALTTTPSSAPGAAPADDKSKGKYIPPSLREGATKRGETMRRDDHTYPIRVANLSESTQDADLEELVKPFGPFSKLYLAKDRTTGLCKGFAYVHFKHKVDAAKAIQTLHGYGYDHLILAVDWSKPPPENR